MVIEGRIEIGR